MFPTIQYAIIIRGRVIIHDIEALLIHTISKTPIHKNSINVWIWIDVDVNIGDLDINFYNNIMCRHLGEGVADIAVQTIYPHTRRKWM